MRNDQTASELVQLEAQIKVLKANIAEETRKLEGKIFPQLKTKIMGRTKWSAAFEAWSADYTGAGVDELIRTPIEADRLNEDDINALEVWADVLSWTDVLATSKSKNKALEATEKLCAFIGNYYPESTHITQTLYFAYKQATDGAEKKQEGGESFAAIIKSWLARIIQTLDFGYKQTKDYAEKKQECGESFAAIITRWLTDDPLHFSSLKWATQFTDVLSADEQLSLTRSAIEHLNDDHRRNGAYHNLAGNIHYLAEEYSEATEYFEQACSRSRKESVYYNNLGHSYFGQKQFKKAKVNYEAAVRFDRDRAIYHSNLALALRELQMWPQAFIECRKAINKDPQNSDHKKTLATIFNAKGNDYYNSGDYAASLEDYEKAIELDPKTTTYHANLAGALAGLMDWERAFAAVEKIKELEPDNVLYTQRLAVIYNARGNDYYGKGNYADSFRDFEKAIELDPKTAIYQANLAGGFAGLKDWERAFAAVEKIKELEPDTVLYTERLAVIHNERGNDYYSKGDYAASLKDYEKAIELDPKTAVYQSNLALALGGLKDWQGAIAAVEKTKELEPDSVVYGQRLAIIYNTRGNEFYEKEDYTAALKDYEKAIELDPKTAVYQSNRAVALGGLKDWQGAIAAVEKTKELEPDEVLYTQRLAVIYNTRGNSFYEKEDYAAALKDYEKAIELDPKTAVYQSNLALALGGLKDWQGAIAAVEKTKELEPDDVVYGQRLAVIYNTRGNEFYEKEDYAAALKDYEKAIALASENAVYHSNLALAYQALRDGTPSIEAWKKALELDPENVEYQHQLNNAQGNDYLAKGDYQKAVKNYEEALTLAPENAVYHSNLALAYLGLHEAERAADAWKKALELDPENVEYQHQMNNALGNDYLVKGDYQKAVKHYEEALTLAPENAVYHSNLALAYQGLRDGTRSIEAWKKALEHDPENADYRHQLNNAQGNDYLVKGDYQEAVKHYEEALTLAPENAVYYSNLALAYQGLRDGTRSIEAWNKALRLDPENADYRHQLNNAQGNDYLVKGDYQEAVKHYEVALALAPKNAVYHANLALAYLGLREEEQAAGAWKKALDLDPENIGYRHQMNNVQGNGYLFKGDFQNAVKHYKEALALAPDNAVYHANLALAYQGLKDWASANDAWKKALELEPENADYRHQLNNAQGNDYLFKGDYQNAVKHYEEGIALAPGNAVYHGNLALAYQGLGQQAHAVDAWKKALELEPENADYRRQLKNAQGT
jgi:tetratricopeptide (TPR) repeat protein